MSDTATTAVPGPPVLGQTDQPSTPRPKPRRDGPFWQALTALASLRLTVVLFVLSFILIFFGTIAQMDEGIWTVVDKYFRSWFLVWVPFQLFVRFGQVFIGLPKDWVVPGAFPFPGGWGLGTLLLLNLLAAHLIRFKVTWKRSGILLIHSGLVLMMLGEVVTGLFAVEGRMIIEQGGVANFVQHDRNNELALVDLSDPTTETHVVIPERLLRQGGTIRHELLPFDVEVRQYLKNSALLRPEQAPAGMKNLADRGTGLQRLAIERPEVSGTDAEQRMDAPSAYVTFLEKQTGQSLGTYLVSAWLNDQELNVGGKSYALSLRPTRTYKPYTIHLIEFRHDRYLGTEKPRNFSSRIRLIDPSRGEDREVLISMNNPLRYAGETFYQASFLQGDSGTVLQVVKNPGWLLPYVSCFIVALGMCVHFGLHLVGFLARRGA